MVALVNPYVKWPVTQGWMGPSHRKTGYAIDYGIPYGTKLLSPGDGRLSLSQDKAAGLRAALILPDDRQIILCHGSDFIAHHGDRVEQLEPIMYSGNSGIVTPAPTPEDPYAGSHLHTFGLTARGVRWNWTLEAAGVPAGGGEEDMPLTDAEKKEIAALSAAAVWAATIGRDAAQVTMATALAQTRVAAVAGQSASEEGLKILQDQVKDWSANGAVTGTGLPGRLYSRLDKAAADLKQSEIDAIADAVVAKLPASGGGALDPAVVKAVVRATFAEVELVYRDRTDG